MPHAVRTTITLDSSLRKAVRASGMRVSEVCRRALRAELTRIRAERSNALKRLLDAVEGVLGDIKEEDLRELLIKELASALDDILTDGTERAPDQDDGKGLSDEDD